MQDGVIAPFWVGIGASAGGLEALREVVRNLDPDLGAVYVVLQHMSPQHKSLLTELIGRETSLRVVEITDGMIGEPDTVHIGPPNSDVIVVGGRLRLVEPSRDPAGPKPSVDRFLQSLAETYGDRAIAIILSGTGSDGAVGIRAVRAAGGITIAQTEVSAKYSGMPVSATETGCVDLQLAADEIGSRFSDIISQPRDLRGISAAEPTDALSNLFQLVQERTGIDFREYKPSTVRRRIERRLTALGFNTIDAYVEHMRGEPEEPKLLCRDMMISVTSFFRDMVEFDKLKHYLDPLIEERASNGIRVWVPGCASGEEAYTLLIMIAEALGGVAGLDAARIQVFATDIDVDALATARRGIYPSSIRENVPAAFLDRYFTRTDDSYQISQALRERIVFTPHNLCQDPPFSNIDVITCRNLLIYFNHALQAKVFSRLHYALKPSGLLFLGKSESISGSEAMFKPAGNNGQVFVRRTLPDRTSALRAKDLGVGRRPGKMLKERDGEILEADTFGSMFHALVRTIGPNGLLVTSDMHIDRVYGNVDRFLSLSEGQLRGATINMLRDDLRHELRTLISIALRQKASRKGLERRSKDGSNDRIQMEVHPISGLGTTDDLLLVIFREWEEEPATQVVPTETGDAAERRIGELEQELMGTRESLQQTVEELETANEELQSLNEELQSANEELQSANEELETTNEELQSTNEELITVNEELQINSFEMATINQEMDSVLSNIAAPVLVVDTRLQIVQWSQSARLMFRITPGVAKPHLSQLRLPPNFPQLTTLMADVIQTGNKSVEEVNIESFRGTIIAAPYFNAKGELIGATAIVQDSEGHAVEARPLLVSLNGDGSRNSGAVVELEVTRRLSDGAEPRAELAGSVRADSNGEANGFASEQNGAMDHDETVLSAVLPQESSEAADAERPDAPLEEHTWSLMADSSGNGATPEVALSQGAKALLGQDETAGTLTREGFLKLFRLDDAASIAFGLDTLMDQAVPFSLKVQTRSADLDAKLLIRGRAERDSEGRVVVIRGDVSPA